MSSINKVYNIALFKCKRWIWSRSRWTKFENWWQLCDKLEIRLWSSLFKKCGKWKSSYLELQFWEKWVWRGWHCCNLSLENKSRITKSEGSYWWHKWLQCINMVCVRTAKIINAGANKNAILSHMVEILSHFPLRSLLIVFFYL